MKNKKPKAPKVPKTAKLWDLRKYRQIEEIKDGVVIKTQKFEATLQWNQPYALARWMKQEAEKDKTNQKGTYFKLTENGKK